MDNQQTASRERRGLDRRTQFDYLLNGLEFAAHADDPAKAGYAEKRRALFSYVRDLEARAAPVQAVQLSEAAEVVRGIVAEVERATHKFPTWPTDPLHAVAVLGEEFGELTKAMLQLTYEPHKTSAEEVRTEAIQTAAMALRLAMSLDRYEYRQCGQHSQQAAASAGTAGGGGL